MPFYRKKPVVIEAKQFTLFDADFPEALETWCNGRVRGTKLAAEDRVIQIDTLEGEMEGKVGDYIIKGIKGEFYPCKPDIFEASYEAVEPQGETSVSREETEMDREGDYTPI